MSVDDKFLSAAGCVFTMLIVFRVSSFGAFLMLLGLLAFTYFATQDD